MSTRTAGRTFLIKEAAALTGLPASTLRYYESVGVVAPVGRSASSGHRVYTQDDLDLLTWVACLNATGLSISDMRQYVANGAKGAAAAEEQVALLSAQRDRLEAEAERLAVRRRYVQLKIDYWQAVADGDRDRARALSEDAIALADELKKTP
ncbi:MerR family transcriptional regulator [Pimelobacter simplex]|uniref:MerR family transcriptional regulator n=1 Tax=Nocardioides simplex TaxID=2045 RepID=UPI001934ACB6|nr:MerR family transcriptional regulator [Pimelobacter simplex]